MGRLRVALALLAAMAAGPALADCDDPAWDSATILARLADAATPGTADLDRDAPAGSAVTLAPVADVPFILPPERAPRTPSPRGAVLRFAGGQAGTYRIALSERAWIDIVPDGAYVPSGARTDLAGCAGLHKIVAFDLGAGGFALQLSDAAAPTLALALARAP